MPPRLLDANASDFLIMNGTDLVESIRLAEGRTLAAEVICTLESPVEGVSHGEIAAAMGADIICLDQYDPFSPLITGAPKAIIENTTPLKAYQQLLGRPIAVNMIVANQERGDFLGGRRISDASIEQIGHQGANMIFLYVRPKLGGTSDMMTTAASSIKQRLANQIMLVGVPSFSKLPPRDSVSINQHRTEINALIQAGCDGIALPMPGSKQGWLRDQVAQLVDTIQLEKCLAWLFVTGSIEGASEAVMPLLALEAKQIGADAIRLDEAGLSGMPVPENILAFSLALRGKRHTYRRMANSILR